MLSKAFLPSLLGMVSVLVGCTPDCTVVTHVGTSVTTDTVAANGQDCEAHIYTAKASDSVGPKP